MRTVDLFCGCGGMSLGFQETGYEIVAAFEFWPLAIQCYQKNFTHPIIQMDLSQINDAITSVKSYNPQIVIGGPPCQDFSNAGNRTEGERAELTYAFAQIVTSVKPQYFVMENVERAAQSEAYKRTLELFQKAGYGITEKVLDASFCGVPQKRKRFFCIGSYGAKDGFLDALLSTNQSILPLTIREYYENQNIELPFSFYYRHPRSYKRRAIFSVDEPAPTIRGVNRPKPVEYKKHTGDLADPNNIRNMTVRERARIQTFPESFILNDDSSHTEQMIGNAVPVRLAAYVAQCILDYNNGSNGEHDLRFIDWLKKEKKYTPRAAGDILSRIKRANKIIAIDHHPLMHYLSFLENAVAFNKINASVQSQIKRAIRLYYEYIVKC